MKGTSAVRQVTELILDRCGEFLKEKGLESYSKEAAVKKKKRNNHLISV